MISLSGIDGNGESKFEQIERLYNRKKLEHPNITLIKQCADLLTFRECDYIAAISEERFKQSTLGTESTVEYGRTSYSAFLNIENNLILDRVRKKISEFLFILGRLILTAVPGTGVSWA